MILYVVVKNSSKTVIEDQKLPEHKAEVDEQLSTGTVTAQVQIICTTAEEVASNNNTNKENGTVCDDSHEHAVTDIHHNEKSMEDYLNIKEGPPTIKCEA